MAGNKGKKRSRTKELMSKFGEASPSKPNAALEKSSSDIPEINDSRLNALVDAANFSIGDNVTLLEITKSLDVKKDDHTEKPLSAKEVFEGSEVHSSRYWFVLVPRKDSNVEEYPSLQSPYIRLKTTGATVSVILKYLKEKLNLTANSEVNVDCHGIKLSQNLSLASVKDIWLVGIPDGTKAKANWDINELMMKLEYYGKLKD